MSAAELARRCHVRGRRVGSEDAAVVWTHAVAAWLGSPAGRAAVARSGEQRAVAEHRQQLLAHALPAALVM